MITGYSDTFNRTVSGGFGTATSGQVYTVNGTASQYSVAPSVGSILPTATGDRFAYVDRQTSDIDISGQVALTGIPATNLMTVGFVVKRIDSSNYYSATMMVATGGAVSVRVSKVIGASLTTLATVATGVTYVANTFYNLRVNAFWSNSLQANVLRAKVWAIGATEPGGWTVSTTDAALTQYTAGTGAGPYARDEQAAPGTITAKIQNVATKTYGLAIPATTDQMCYTPGTAGMCSIGIADGTFETTTGAWTATNSTYLRQNAVVHSGSWAGQITPTGTPAQMYVRPTTPAYGAPVTVGQSYTATMWVRSATAFPTVAAAIDWFDSSFTYLTSSSVNIALTANVWQLASVTATAPASAAYAIYGPTVVSPGAGQVLYFDDVDFQTTCSTPTVPYPKTTVLQALAVGADTAMVAIDSRMSTALAFPRVRVSVSNVTTPAGGTYSIPFNTTEFNVGTSTNLSYGTNLSLPVGIWYVSLELEIASTASLSTIQVQFSGGSGVSNGQYVYMRTNVTNSNDNSRGGSAHVSYLAYSPDSSSTRSITATLFLNASVAYTVKYAALSAIKISDYF